MTDKKKLKTDMSELCYALEDHAAQWFLNPATGEVACLPDHLYGPERDEAADEIDEWDRFERVSRVESHEAFEDMEDFIETVEDEETARELDRAIRRGHTFRRFKDALEGYPDERERWFSFQNARLRERALEWLDEIGIIPIE